MSCVHSPSKPRRRARLPVVLAMALLSSAAAPGFCETPGGHFADADDAQSVASGKLIYRQRCASCHGKRLQGQPLWQLEDEYAHRRAPAHDQTGHTWLHSDEELFQMTRAGRFPGTPPDRPSYMPGFAGSLADTQILAVIAFIKATWPVGLRIAQAMRNPDNAGMPAHAADSDWTLPPNCTIATQRWRSPAR